MPQKFILTRIVTQKECSWLERDFLKGEIVYSCSNCTYGCISPGGVACTLDSSGDYPFFELPEDSIKNIS